jgi:hypothetical protein
MRYNPFPTKSDTSIGREAWDNVCRQIRKLLNLKFDQTVFQTIESPSGTYVTTRRGSTDATADTDYHFKGVVIESNVAANIGTIEFHGGIGKKYTNNTVYKIPLTTDDGTSEHFEDVKTINNVVSSQYFWAEFDDPLVPTTLTINNAASYPTDDGNLYQKTVLGYANVSSTNGVSTMTWEPYYVGGDIIDEGVVPDSASAVDNNVAGRKYLSHEFSSRSGHEGELQDYNWDDLTTSTLTGDDHVIIRSVADISTSDQVIEKKYAATTLQQLLTNVHYNTSLHRIEMKYVTARVIDCSGESAWTMIENGQLQACP